MNIIPAFLRRRIAHRPNLVKIVDNISWLFFDKVLRMGVGLLVGVWMARYLGPEQFGLLNFALAFTGLFGAIATLGLQGIVVRDIVRNPESAPLTLGTAAVLQLAGGLISFLLNLGAIAHLRPDDALARTVVTILGTVTLLKASEFSIYWFESQLQSKYIVWMQNGVFLVFAAVKIGLILFEAPLGVFAWAILAEAIVVAAILLLIFNWRGPKINHLRASINRAQTLLKDSWYLILTGIAIMVYMKIDQIMLGQIMGDEAVGIYSAAVRISEAWYFIPMAIVASVFPVLIEAKKRSEEQYYAKLQRLYDLMVLIGVAVAVPITLISTPLVILLFGPEFSDAGVALAVHIWATIFVSLGVASSTWFLTENLQKLYFQRTLCGALANVILNLFLIPKFGINGAAVALLISQMIVTWIFDGYQRETRWMFWMKTKAMNPARWYRLVFDYQSRRNK